MHSHPIVVGLGEVLWDIYPDGPRLGGAPANFACHAASLGAEAHFVGSVGQDELGNRALAELQGRSVRCDHLQRDESRATGRVLVSLDSSGSAAYEIAADAAWDHIVWNAGLETLARSARAACFGTLAQRGPASRETIRRFLGAMAPESLRVFDVNLRQNFHSREIILDSLSLADVLKVNEDELPVLAERCGLRKAPPRETLRELVRRHGLRLAALTLGSKGSLLVSPKEVNVGTAAPASVVDTVGAGDSFTAALVVGLLYQRSLADISRYANSVASFVCSQRGGAPALPSRLRFKGNIPRR